MTAAGGGDGLDEHSAVRLDREKRANIGGTVSLDERFRPMEPNPSIAEVYQLRAARRVVGPPPGADCKWRSDNNDAHQPALQ
jgi:hypothetical protein